MRVSPTSRRAPFPPPSLRGGILSLRGRERIPGVPFASQEEALSTGKARGNPGSCHIPRVPQMTRSIPGKTVFPAVPRLSRRGSTHTTVELGVLLKSPPWSQSSSRVGTCTYAFFPSCSSSVTLPFAWIKGSVAFPRGFPTRLSHEAFPQGCPTCHRGVSRSSA